MSVVKPFQRYISSTKTQLLLAGTLSVIALAFAVSQIWADPKPADLSESPFALTANLLAEWQDGDVIVFVRHLERCSRVEAACLGEPTGITQRATTIGLELREQFLGLGLESADIYSSPLIRTSQTSELVFAAPVTHEDFLYQCKENFVQDALAKKIPGRNLVLVTHSSCMDEVNEHLDYADLDYEYGASVFMNVESHAKQQILGFIDADDWSMTLAPKS
ncbi:histidine phosphatase family protein [Denitrificimonas caeni]|uniref:lipopolysaccharide core heptose(II)-phosphate phosphatase PmrG n=1 Tax=Denitrificimonas caeni TaxID=521720 RepID=UPI00196614DD|nr:histidine phosphatase family protein [Denitrificimonas caeni]